MTWFEAPMRRWINFLSSRKVFNDRQLFLENLQLQPLSERAYTIWYLYKKEKEVEFVFRLNPFKYIFRSENKYTLLGANVLELKHNIRWFKTNIVLMFDQKELWDTITQQFQNFRDLETNNVSDLYNTYITFKLDIKSFNSNFSVGNNIIELPSSDRPLPKRYRPVSGGLNFAFIKNNNVVSFAAAPHILSRENYSFAILRGVETKLTERKQGYALQTVSVLCKELFSRYQLSSLFLWVEERNKDARKLYEKIGFESEGRILATYCDQKS